MSTNNKIIILDNVFTNDECLELIKYYNDKGATHQWQTFFPMTINQNDEFLKPKIKKIENLAQNNFGKQIIIDWCEITKWPTNSFQSLHLDASKSDTILTSITYLNSDYTGGQTFIKNDIEVIPKTGRTLIFNGQFYEHGVKEILSGTRYTIPIWYKTNKVASPY